LAIALSLLFSVVTQHAKADDDIRSAHDVKARLEELAQKFSLLYHRTENELLPELREEIGSALYLRYYEKLTTQKTLEGAIFKYFPGFPENDPRHALGPAWIYQESHNDWLRVSQESRLKRKSFHDRLRDKNNEIRKVTRFEAKNECQKFGEKTRLLDDFDLAHLDPLKGTNYFLDLYDEEGEKDWVWVESNGALLGRKGIYTRSNDNGPYAIRCVTEIEKTSEGTDQESGHK
jgi:hypothetical protein